MRVFKVIATIVLLTGCQAGDEQVAPVSRPTASSVAGPTATTAAAQASGAEQAAQDEPAGMHWPAPLAQIKGGLCKAGETGGSGEFWECEAGDYRIRTRVSYCKLDGVFGNIVAPDAGVVALHADFTAVVAQPVARLRHRQFVCELAWAGRGNLRQWVYVVAVPSAGVPACKRPGGCGDPGDLPVEWLRPREGRPCAALVSGEFSGDCAAGWMEARHYRRLPSRSRQR